MLTLNCARHSRILVQHDKGEQGNGIKKEHKARQRATFVEVRDEGR